ncbi:MAG: hypothetical protein ACERKX_12825, partial [Anaerolineales bacterium]
MLDLFRNRKKSMHLAVLLALMVVLLAPVGAAYADGEPPPEPPPVEEVGEPEPVDSTGEDGEGDETASPDPSESESAGETAPPLVEATEGVQVPGQDDEGTGEEPSVTDSENVEGEAISNPPTSVDQLGLLPAPDPYYTYLGNIYRYSSDSSYCTTNYPGDLYCYQGVPNPIQQSITDLVGFNSAPDDNDVNGNDKTIYVEDGTYAENVVINGGAWGTTPSLLVLQSENGSGLTTIDGSFTIQAMLDFILRGF